MNIIRYVKKGIPIQYNNFVAVTPVPGLKFTNWDGRKGSIFFWYLVLSLGCWMAFAVNMKFWYQYQVLNFATVYKDLELGIDAAFPAVYLCLRNPLDPIKLAKYRTNFLLPNFTTTTAAIDSHLQYLFRVQRAPFNMTKNISAPLYDNVDTAWLDQNLDKLFYQVDDQLKECSFKGVHRGCHKIFKATDTVIGRCFVFNSIFTDSSLHEDPHNVWYANISEFEEDWSLRFKIFHGSGTLDAMIYLQHPTNMLALRNVPTYKWQPIQKTTDYYFSLIQHYSDPQFRTMTTGLRKCYFSDDEFVSPDLRAEFNAGFYDQGVCLNHCYARKFWELCSCWPNFAKTLFPKMGNNLRICGFKDIECYENNYLSVRKTKCSDCYVGCMGVNYFQDDVHYLQNPDVQDYSSSLNSSLEGNYYELNIQVIFWPVTYLKIINIFSLTELILSVASTTCLFLGVSVLTLVEMFYNLFVRFPLFYFKNREYFLTTIGKREELECRQLLPCINLHLKPSRHNKN